MTVNRFKLARILEGKKQIEVASLTEIPISVLSLIENNWLVPKPHQIKKLERALPKLRDVESLIK